MMPSPEQRDATQRNEQTTTCATPATAHRNNNNNSATTNTVAVCGRRRSRSSVLLMDGARTGVRVFSFACFLFAFFEWLRVTFFIPILVEPGMFSTTVYMINVTSNGRTYAVQKQR